MNVSLISITPDAERTMAYIARVSSPHQDNPEIEKLLAYCIKHGHWSVYEHAHLTIEIETSRAIAQQILRHRSFTFSEFSQRYAAPSLGFETYPARSQDSKNRQNSLDNCSAETQEWFEKAQLSVQQRAFTLYQDAMAKGIAKEQARMLLPLGVRTRLYMTGSVRSWMHYILTRTDASTQKEHRDIALGCQSIFIKKLPVISRALNWTAHNE